MQKKYDLFIVTNGINTHITATGTNKRMAHQTLIASVARTLLYGVNKQSALRRMETSLIHQC